MDTKASLHFLCTEKAKEIEIKEKITISEDAIGLVTESTFRFCQILATDLELFAIHAKRSSITADDLLLFCRRNSSLIAFIRENMKNLSSNNEQKHRSAQLKINQAFLPKEETLDSKSNFTETKEEFVNLDDFFDPDS